MRWCKVSFVCINFPCALVAVGLLSPKRVQKRLSSASRGRSVLPLYLSLSPLLSQTHTDTHTQHTRSYTQTGGHPWSLAASSSKLTEDERAACVLLLQIATASPTAECLHSDTSWSGLQRGFSGALDASVRKMEALRALRQRRQIV